MHCFSSDVHEQSAHFVQPQSKVEAAGAAAGAALLDMPPPLRGGRGGREG